jgi:hypothetical protein
MTFGPEGDQSADKGVWISVWVDAMETEYRTVPNRVWT